MKRIFFLLLMAAALTSALSFPSAAQESSLAADRLNSLGLFSGTGIDASGAPMSGSIQTTKTNLTALSTLPVWTFVGSADTLIDPEQTKAFVYALRDRNAQVQLTVLSGAGHRQVPSQAYLNHDVVSWLINHQRTTNQKNRADHKSGRLDFILLAASQKTSATDRHTHPPADDRTAAACG